MGHIVSQTGRSGWDIVSGTSCPGWDVPDGTFQMEHDVPSGTSQTRHPIWDMKCPILLLPLRKYNIQDLLDL